MTASSAYRSVSILIPAYNEAARKTGHRIAEVPISYRPRSVADEKKIRARDGVQALATLIRERIAQ